MLKDVNNPDNRRYSDKEVQEAAEYGLDLSWVKSNADLANAEIALIEAIPDTDEGREALDALISIMKVQQPELYEKFITELRKNNPRPFMKLILPEDET